MLEGVTELATKPDLTRVDIPPIDYQEFSPEMQLWLSNLVDTLNQMMTDIENSLP